MKYLEAMFLSTGVLVWTTITIFLLFFAFRKVIDYIKTIYPFTLLNLLKLKLKYKNDERMIKYYALNKWITRKDSIRMLGYDHYKMTFETNKLKREEIEELKSRIGK